MIDIVGEILRADQRIGAVQAVDDQQAAGLQVAPAQAQELELLVERQVVELLLGDDHVERLAVLLEVRNASAVSHGRLPSLGVRDLSGSESMPLDAGIASLASSRSTR